MRRCAPVAFVVAALSFAAPLAWAQKDLKTEPTTKAGAEPTTKTGAEPTTKTGGDVPALPPPVKPSTTAKPEKPEKPLEPKPSKPPPESEPKPEPSASASAPEPEPEAPPAPSASAAKPAGPFARKKVALGVGDLALTISVPESWSELPESSLPAVEESSDVKVVARKGFGVHDPKGKPPRVEEVIVVCGKASGDYWADAVRDAAFTQMTAAIEKEARKYTTVQSIEPEPVHEDGNKLLQSFATEVDFAPDGKAPMAEKGKSKKAPTVKLQGLSFIGFTPEPADAKTPEIVACSVACAQLSDAGDAPICAPAIGSIELSGNFVAPPKRSAMTELFFKLKKDPTTLWLVVIGAFFAMLAIVALVVIALRKRRASDVADDHDEDEEDDALADRAAAEIRGMHASPPPDGGYFDPQTLARRKA